MKPGTFPLGAAVALLCVSCAPSHGAAGSPAVVSSCPSGTHRDARNVCVADVLLPQHAATEPRYPATADAGGMVSIPAGTFSMGSNDGPPDEKPVHAVHVEAFEMDLTEVTVNSYAACLRAGKCKSRDPCEACNLDLPGRGNHPMNGVSWHEASAYCAYVGKRLPTEEEWEYAARGTDGRTYPWGNEPPTSQLCWNPANDFVDTCEVGRHPSGDSPFGLHDMAGNVWEWTASGFSHSYDAARSSTAFIFRGGQDNDGVPPIVKATTRNGFDSTFSYIGLGFRCAR